MRAEFGMPNSPQSPDISQNLDGGISNFQVSGQPLQTKIIITPELVMILT